MSTVTLTVWELVALMGFAAALGAVPAALLNEVLLGVIEKRFGIVVDHDTDVDVDGGDADADADADATGDAGGPTDAAGSAAD